MKYTVMIPAAGSGTRMGANMNKLFLQLDRRPILAHTLDVFERDDRCESIILAVKREERVLIQAVAKKYNITKARTFVDGGKERQQSVHACLEAYPKEDGIVLVHDAARPFVTHETIGALVDRAAQSGGAVAAVRAKDTMKVVKDGIIEETVDRSTLWSIQTPQAFRYTLLKQASDQANEAQFEATDEAMLVERIGVPVAVVESTYDNVKMTTTEDLVFGEAILKSRKKGNK